MKLARALKEKNRKVERISQLRSDIQSNNSLPTISEREIDVAMALGELNKAVEDLIQFKIKIFVATNPIREHILRIGELKSENSFWKSLSTRRGVVNDRFSGFERSGDEIIKYEAIYTKAHVDQRVALNEKQIDKLQEDIDEHNHTTEIS